VKVSLNKLRNLTTDEQPTADARPAQVDRLLHVSDDVMDTIQEVFAGTELLTDPAKLNAVLETRREVGAAWERAKSSFIEIGRALNRLDVHLRTKEERTALKAGFERLFPLSEPIASQFRKVAEMIDSGRVSADACPGSYSAAYQLALLEPKELETAQSRGLVAPTTSRSVLIAFRREQLSASQVKIDVPALLGELRRLRARRKRMLDEMIKMRRRAMEIVQLLKNDSAN